MEYRYDAAGNRISKYIYNNSSSITKSIEYIGGYVIENDVLSYYSMAEGRVRNEGGGFGLVLKMEYFITDQQGNTRVSFEDNNGTAALIQENSYYAFGMQMAGGYTPTTNPNKKLYNAGSEWQDDIDGLADYYSTFFREYDAIIGRFNGVDPMAEVRDEITTYAYANNNPVMMNDPLGNLASGPGKGWHPTDYGWLPNLDDLSDLFESISDNYLQTAYLLWHEAQYGGRRRGGSLNFGTGVENDPQGGGGGPRGGTNLLKSNWTSKGIWKVHQRANRVALIGSDPIMDDKGTAMVNKVKGKLNAMNDGTVWADADMYQTGAYSFMHAMRHVDKKKGINQSIEMAKYLADKYVREMFKLAKEAKAAGNEYNAYFFFGAGLHTLQDATSPVHGGFQPWEDNPKFWREVVPHVYQERSYPGIRSNLQKITNYYLNWFENGEILLPTGNLFDNILTDN